MKEHLSITIALLADQAPRRPISPKAFASISRSLVRPFTKREVMPGNLKGAELENFIRDAAVTYWHQTCTAKMGRDSMSVVDANLKVYGIEKLRIADGSIMPRITTGNTMAPCIIIGERAGEILKADHKL
jgi:choline dehydrogenase-like flavoprotein